MTALRFVDFFAGVGGIRLGLARAGHNCVGSCEIDNFAREVYAARYGSAPEMEDIREVTARDIPEADLWTGGFPCQDLSSAGRRAGIRGERSGLIWRLLALAGERKPEWLLLENVRGLLTGADGTLEPDDEDVGETAEELVSWLGVLLGALVELGYVGSLRVLDAQYFGVPQRRRRVFIVARHSGAGRGHPARVLAERAGVRGDREAGRAPGPDAPGAAQDGAPLGRGARRVASTISASYGDASPRGDGADTLIAHPLTAREGKGADSSCTNGNVIPYVVKSMTSVDQETHARPASIARCIDTTGGYSAHQGGNLVIAFDPTQITHRENRCKCEPGAPAPALAARARAPHIAYPFSIAPASGQGSDLCAAAAAVSPALTATGDARKTERGIRVVQQDEVVGWRVRRLTPRECERLQGLPDDWTLVPGATPTQRYRVLGNSVAVPWVKWIGERLAEAD